MGYKLAGYTVVGNLEIDKSMEELYVKNLKPKYTYCMDIREFNQLGKYPKELKMLDILDGSPPCTTFSMAGDREKSWGKEKQFQEGQKKQRLDDLFFHFIHTAEILKPKVVIAENVEGLLRGNAKGYVNEIVHMLQKIGYEPQIFLLNAATMGVPQRRKRCFFIAHRKDMAVEKLKLDFHEPQIPFGAVRSDHGVPIKKDGRMKNMIKYRRESDQRLCDIVERTERGHSQYNNILIHDGETAPTIPASGCLFRFADGNYLSAEDLTNVSTFPQDYDFCGKNVQYVCGMSVPPVMIANIATEVFRQWLE